MKRSLFPSCAALVLAVAAGCGDTLAKEAARVFVSASMAEAFRELAEEFERTHPGQALELHVAGTAQLVMQLQAGAPADVFAAADRASLERLERAGLLATRPQVCARNRLAIVTQAGNPLGLQGLGDLARDGLTVLFCGPTVPAGRYARQALERAGVSLRSASDEPSVRAVLSKVRLGEADAGLVYATDLEGASDLAGLSLAPEHDVVTSCAIATLSGGSNPGVGEAFVAFVLSDTGHAILGSHGFLAP